ncbi:unnamed protein product, partial [Ascophyllum nodosum]
AFSEEQIHEHVKSLDSGMHLTQERIQIISHPMDLGTIARKLDKQGSGGY